MHSDKYANSWNQPDTFRIIYTSKATFYGERKHKDETEIALSKSMQEAIEAKPNEEEIMNRFREATRRQETRNAADREIREEKKRQKAQRRMNYMKTSLSPEWKKLPGNKFKCSQTRKLTAIDIMDMVDNGELTDEQAEIEFNKLEERKNKDKENMDTATVKEAKNILNELNHMKSSLSHEWKLLPGNEFKCLQTKKLTANDIMDMIDNGELTDEQADIEFEKLENRKNKDKKTWTLQLSRKPRMSSMN